MFDAATMKATRRIPICLYTISLGFLLVDASWRKECERGTFVCDEILPANYILNQLWMLEKGEVVEEFLVREVHNKSRGKFVRQDKLDGREPGVSRMVLFSTHDRTSVTEQGRDLGNEIYYKYIRGKLEELIHKDDFLELLNSDERERYFKIQGKRRKPWKTNSKFELLHMHAMLYKPGQSFDWHTDFYTAMDEGIINFSINLMPAMFETGMFCTSTRTWEETRDAATGNLLARGDPAEEQVIKHYMKQGSCVCIPALVENSVTSCRKTVDNIFFPDHAMISLVVSIKQTK